MTPSKPQPELRLRINDPIGSPDGPVRARIGLFVVSADGLRFALTSRHAIDALEGAALWFEGGVLENAATSSHAAAGDELRPLGDAVFELPLPASVEIDFGGPLKSSEVASNPLVGDLVVRHNGRGEPEEGRITGLGGLVRISTEAGVATAFTQTVRVKFEGDDEFLEAGAAGGLICDAAGRALAIIITSRRAACYAAPLAQYLSSRALSPAVDHRESAALSMFQTLLEEVSAFKQMLQSSPSPYPTVGQAPPEDLIKLERRVEYADRP